MDASTAAILQQVASSTVLDSLEAWNIGVLDPVAQPQYTDLGGGQVSLSETSTNATQHSWDLGDGNTSTASSFTHTYANGGHYTVTYIAADDCGRADTSTFSLDIMITGISEGSDSGFQLFADMDGLRLANPGAAGTLDLFDAQGRLLNTIQIPGPGNHLIPKPDAPFVLWRFSSGDGMRTGKVVR